MKRASIITLGIVSGAVLTWVFAQAGAGVRPIADIMPAGALVYVEAKDLAALVHDWNGSQAKATWLKSANYQVFSQSRLFLRFSQAQDEFAATAGLPPDMNLLESVAGGNSGLALYDIGKLQFLYIARMPSARAFQTVLWQSRAKFQPRNSGGTPYFVREDAQHFAAFAVTNDYFLVATQEGALASALAILAGEQRPLMKQERWYDQAVASTQNKPGDVRMVLNFERLTRTPYFQSYWIQQNISELRQFNAVISDLDRSATEMRESRVLLRAEAGSDMRPAEPAIAQVTRLAPPDAGLYRAWAAPSINDTVELIVQKLISPHTEAAAQTKTAPSAPATDAMIGTEGDLETRIDEPPFVQNDSGPEVEALRRQIEAAHVESAIQIQSTRAIADRVFMETPSVIALEATTPWNADALRSAITTAAGSMWSIADLGANWKQARAGNTAYSELDGLGRLQVATSGKLLIIGNSVDLFAAVLSRLATPAASQSAVYAVRYQHGRELPDFERMTRLIDYPGMPASDGNPHEPLFFSQNIASLGRTLGRLDTMSMDVHDDGAALRQLVVYRLK